MKKVKNKFLMKYNRIIIIILSLLGFSTVCVQTYEYGTPSADFIVKGAIQSEENNQLIPNIMVVSKYDTIYSDYEGKYYIKNDGYFPSDQTFLLEFEDIDGQENGEFHSLDTLIEFIDPDFSGGDGDWYEGETEKVLNIKLKPKN